MPQKSEMYGDYLGINFKGGVVSASIKKRRNILKPIYKIMSVLMILTIIGPVGQ